MKSIWVQIPFSAKHHNPGTMLKRLSTLLVVVLPLTLVAQTASITEGCLPLEVSFTAPPGASGFFWDFQDGATATLQNPVHNFTTPGTYEVEFSEGIGQPVIGTVTVTIYAQPVLEIATDTAMGCVPVTVNFEDLTDYPEGLAITNYTWVFGDGNSSSGEEMVSHTYNTGGNFSVSLEVETNLNSCNTTEIFPELLDISEPANVRFATIPDTPMACTPPLLVSFLNQTTGGDELLSFEWNFGNGTIFNGMNPPAQTFTEEGLFNVSLTARDDNGCIASTSRPVKIGPPLALFAFPDTVCLGDTIDFENLSDPGLYSWDFGPAASPQLTEDSAPRVVFNQKGVWDITLEVLSPDSCVGDTTLRIFVDKADAFFTSDPSFSCSEPVEITYTPLSEEATSWLWTFGNGTFSTEESPTFFWDHMDTTTYSENGRVLNFTRLAVTNASGCSDTIFRADTLRLPNALFMPDVIDGCAPLTVTLSDSSTAVSPIIRWEYDYGDGTTAVLSSDEPHTHTYSEPGEYQVQLNIETETGCIDTSYQLTIEVGEALSPDFEVDQIAVCPGDTVRFTDLTNSPLIDAWHFTTENGRSFHCFQEPELAWSFDSETGPMDVTLTVEYNGCQSSITKEGLISVNGPIARIDYEMDCAAPFDYQFRDSSQEATLVQWYFGDGDSSSMVNPMHTYDSTGNYQVVLRAENPASGCPASLDTTVVCVREIKADFNVENKVCQGQMYELDASNAQDVDADCWKGYDWFFEISGRPITTQDSVIEFAFPTGGQETVTLVVEDINGCHDTVSQTLQVYELDASFSLTDQHICFPATVNFNDLSTADTTITSWQWDFGDNTSSMESSPSHAYEQPPGMVGDTITVGLTIMDALGCSSGKNVILTTYEPVSDIITDPAVPNICTGTPIDFEGLDYTEAGSNLTFSWNFDNEETASTQSASTTYPEAGTYLVTLNYEEIGSGCGGVETQLVNVQDYPQAAFTSSVDDNPILCYPQNILFTDASSSDFNLSQFWNFGNGQTATGPMPAAAFGKGTFEVLLTVSTSFGCWDTLSRQFTLVGPEGDFGVSPEAICLGESMTFELTDTVDVGSFTWDFGDGLQESDINPITHLYEFVPPSGQTIAKLILRGEDESCTFIVEKEVDIVDVIPNFIRNDGVDTTLCVGSYPFTNNSSNADRYFWDFGNGTTSIAVNPTANYEEPGVYIVQLIAENTEVRCIDSIEKEVVIVEPPLIMAIGDTICPGDTAQLNIANPLTSATYLWSPTDLILDNEMLPNPTTAPGISTVYTVEVTDEDNCTSIDSAVVVVGFPLDTFTIDTTLAEGELFTLPGPELDDFYDYFWLPSDGLSCTDCTMPEIMALEDITYLLIAEDPAGCFENVFTFNIDVITDRIEVPNVFTPNNDGVNDRFNVISELEIDSEFLRVLKFKVFNRWGQLIYDNDTPLTGWDGRHNGKDAPSDVYVYVISVELPHRQGAERFREFSGDLTLLR